MNLELQQLDLRYEKLPTRKPEAERELLASLAEIGQQVPVVVVRGEAPEQFVLIDGYKRVRALRRLGQDLVAGTCWDLREVVALALRAHRILGEACGHHSPARGELAFVSRRPRSARCSDIVRPFVKCLESRGCVHR